MHLYRPTYTLHGGEIKEKGGYGIEWGTTDVLVGRRVK